jgi:hypothetical protein
MPRPALILGGVCHALSGGSRWNDLYQSTQWQGTTSRPFLVATAVGLLVGVRAGPWQRVGAAAV